MFTEFLAALILLVVIYHLFQAVFVLVLAMFHAWAVKRRGESGDDRLQAIANQVISSLFLAGLVALLCRFTNDKPEVTFHYVYSVTGFFVVLFLLSANAGDKEKLLRDEVWPSPTQEGAYVGAQFATPVGLFFFVLVYNAPWVITWIPGAYTGYSLLFALADWVSGFWIVQLLLYLAVGSYVLSFGWFAVVMAGMATYAMWNWIRKLGRKSEPRSKSASAD